MANAIKSEADRFLARFPRPVFPVVRSRGGCKVGWETYATREEAEAVGAWESRWADLMRAGYDYGYLSPGSVSPDPMGGFEVVTT